MKTSNPSFFIVEDDAFYAELVKNVLKNESYENVTIFHNGEDCLANIDQQPDIVILDYMLGQMSGLHILRKIKEKYPKIQVILLSGQDQMQIAVNAVKIGAVDYIEKTHQAAMTKLLIIVDRTLKSLKAPYNHRIAKLKDWFLID